MDALPLGKEPPEPTGQDAGWHQEQGGGEIKLLPLPGIELDHSLVTRPTELRRLRLSVCIPNSRQPLILRQLPSTHTTYCSAALHLPSNCASFGSNVDYAGGQRDCDHVGGKQNE